MDEESSEEDFPGRLLHQAALWGNAELLEDLLNGEELQLLDSVDTLGRTALHAAATNENEICARILLQAGANPNIRCSQRGFQKTPLHVAAESGHVSTVRLLLSHGADLLARDATGLTPFDVADRACNADTIAVLRKAADDKEEEQKEVYEALWNACGKGDTSDARTILQQLGKEAQVVVNTAPKGCSTLLFKACEEGQTRIVELLLEFGANGRTHPVTRYSPLYIACYYGRKEIVEMLLQRFPELIKVTTVEKWLPLHAAAISGHLRVMDRLLNFDYPSHLMETFRDKTQTWEFNLAFDINARDVTEQSVLYLACYLANHRMVDLLLKFNVKARRVVVCEEPEEVSREIPTGRKLSEGLQVIVSRLAPKTGDREIARNELDLCPLDLDLYCNQGAETALHVAVRNKQYSIASLLLQKGADPNLCIRSTEEDQGLEEPHAGSTALVEACRNRDPTVVDLLIRYGARDDDCRALCTAKRYGDEAVASKLLGLKAYPDPEYKINKRALDISPQMLGRTNSLTYGALFPTVPVMVNWHGQHCLHSLQEQWLVEACVAHNVKLKLSPQSQQVALAAITRLDVSNNQIGRLPSCIFHLPSLKILNLAQNKIERLPDHDESMQLRQWSCSLLEEIHLQDNRLEYVPDYVFKLSSLTLLDLSNNKLQSLPVWMWSAPKLRELNVSLNLLHDLPHLPSVSVEGEVLHHSTKTESSSSQALCPDHSPITLSSANLQSEKLLHHNFWSRSVDVVDSLPDESSDCECRCQLVTLNLAHNLYDQVPPSLACCCPNLARLNLSYNRLEGMGPVGNYPLNLKHLELSHNRISSWLFPSHHDYSCYNPGDSSKSTKRSANRPPSQLGFNPSCCLHRKHSRLDNLRTLILADNELERLTLDWELQHDEEYGGDLPAPDAAEASSELQCAVGRSRSIFPNLSMLDVSNNRISEIPTTIAELSNLSVLNVSGNCAVSSLPPQMGLLAKLWNLNTRGCSLGEPLKAMMDSKKYKTMDIIGYLKSVLENARTYARMKLMIVGVQGIGKTSLLEQLRQEGTGTYRKRPPEHWAKRMGNKNINLKTAKGISLSTVGVDVGDWTYEKKVRGQSSHGPVAFRTWDFAGQREYYATHQYFLSKRSLYLVVWRITDGERGVDSILQWLVNIQARAPNAPVLIVGTHYDTVRERFPSAYSEELQQSIRERFINVVDADKCGLPRVLDTIEVSCRTRHNIKLLCNLVYDTVFSLCCPGSKEKLLEQKIPATYLALEDVVGYLAMERRLQGKDPVLRAEQYKMLVMHEMQNRFNIAFRDVAELNQATAFLHENGVLLHYEDATLKDLYFLDPQWLCDMLAHVVTIREINPFARNGVMKIDDLQHVFKSSQCAPTQAQNYILNLLNKFEVALSWDSRTLLVPSLLSTEDQLRAGLAGCDVRVPVRSRGWALRKNYASSSGKGNSLHSEGMSPGARPQTLTGECIGSPGISDSLRGEDSAYFLSHQTHHERSLFRLLLVSYFPSGFWSRLMTRILADGSVVEVVRSFFDFPRHAQTDPVFVGALSSHAEWICWQTGMELRYLDATLLRLKEVLPHLENHPCDYYQHARFLVCQEGSWTDLDVSGSSLLEMYLPHQEVVLQHTGQRKVLPATLRPNRECTAKLLSLAVNHIDTLLEDWYPTLGTRFVHTSEGRFLVTRLVPCTQCLQTLVRSSLGRPLPTDDAWQIVDVSSFSAEPRISKSLSVCAGLPLRSRGSRESTASRDSGVVPDSNSSSRKTSAEGSLDDTVHRAEDIRIHGFLVEECILAAYEQQTLKCPAHGDQTLSSITPDVVFLDLGERYTIRPENIKRGKMLGRGAFGFVFKATVKQRGSSVLTDVAMKMLQPVDPGFGARQSDTVAYKAAWSKWQRDSLQYACKAYCTARQELDILLMLRHPSIVPLVGICSRPLSLVLQLAPMGALDTVLRNYRRSGARLDAFVLQKVVLQIARALEYLHQQHIIYRDLKSENVLVWQLPPPFQQSTAHPQVDVKLADYGISRSTLPTGAKGFGGTEGFMAPEIMRYNGEEEYTEKVDCFSFGMFLYELVTLHLPFEGQECVKDHILEGGRPSVTSREMTYPTYVLDLMTLCWAQQPKDRPSASQIVSVATAPEFVHLADVVSLQDQNAVLSAAALRLSAPPDGWQEADTPSWEVWVSRLGKQVDILSCGDCRWQEYKVLGTENVSVTSLCVVEELLWLGDSRGSIHIYSSSAGSYAVQKTHQLDPDAAAPMAVRSMAYSPRFGTVAVSTSTGRIWLCDSECVDTREIEGNGNLVFCMALVSLDSRCEMWCGQTQGTISVFALAEPGALVISQEVVHHYDPVVENMDVTQLASATDEGPTVWSYIYPGCVIYQWDVVGRQVLHKLDCSKLAPCSESLVSISIEEHLSPGRCQVTAMAAYGGELYVGTTWGCIVVAEGATMRPVTVFRPFEEEVKAILPLGSTPPLLATVGKGYRNLIGRYAPLPSVDDESRLSSSMFLLLWQAKAWSAA